MIKTKEDLKSCLKYEKGKYRLSKFYFLSSLFGVSERALIWKYQKRLRKWEYHLNNNHKLRTLFCAFFTKKLGLKLGFLINPNCFDVGLKIMHIGSITINANSRIGKDCSIHINTALVATGGNSDSPTVGDKCVFGIGSILIGGIHLGNEVAVGAGAVVTKSFDEDHITIAGVPAKIVSHKAII